MGWTTSKGTLGSTIDNVVKKKSANRAGGRMNTNKDNNSELNTILGSIEPGKDKSPISPLVGVEDGCFGTSTCLHPMHKNAFTRKVSLKAFDSKVALPIDRSLNTLDYKKILNIWNLQKNYKHFKL